MAKKLDDHVRDNGLVQISTAANWGGGVMNMVMCMREPTSAADAAALYPSGARVSDVIAMAEGDYTLQNRAGGGREVAVAAKSAAAAVTVAATTGLTATGGTVSTLDDADQAWTVDEHKGWLVEITGGTGAGQVRIIASNTATQLVPTVDFTTAPDNTSVYSIKPDVCVAHYDGGASPRVLAVINESQDNDIANGSTLNIPAHAIGFGLAV